jgi:hypothetical protein
MGKEKEKKTVRRMHPFDETFEYEPKIWSGVIEELKINTEPVMSRMSYKEGKGNG